MAAGEGSTGSPCTVHVVTHRPLTLPPPSQYYESQGYDPATSYSYAQYAMSAAQQPQAVASSSTASVPAAPVDWVRTLPAVCTSPQSSTDVSIPVRSEHVADVVLSHSDQPLGS